MNIDGQGRSSDHPAEITKRDPLAERDDSLRGFYDTNAQSGQPRLIFGDGEKFAADLQRYNS